MGSHAMNHPKEDEDDLLGNRPSTDAARVGTTPIASRQATCCHQGGAAGGSGRLEGPDGPTLPPPHWATVTRALGIVKAPLPLPWQSRLQSLQVTHHHS
jgi:hypothetical protein